MATTLNPARPFPEAGVYPLDSGHFDEAFAETGTARPPYVTVVDALAWHNLVELRERVRSNVDRIGLSFGPGRPMVVGGSKDTWVLGPPADLVRSDAPWHPGNNVP